jgi:putative ABC transport system permease protein
VRHQLRRPTTLALPDLLGEAVASIIARPGRTVLTSAGTLLGATWFVAVLGLVSTATGQVVTDFAARLATVVVVTAPRAGGLEAGYPYPANVARRLDALPGVRSAGVFWRLRPGEPTVASARSPTAPTVSHRSGRGLTVLAVSPGFLAAAGVTVSAGRPFGPWDQFHATPACLVGALAAKALGIAGPGRRPAVEIDGVACVAIGIVGQVRWRQSILRSVLLPSATALAYWGPPGEGAGSRPAVLIRVRPGAAGVVAREAPVAISATRPRRFVARVPPGPWRLAGQVGHTLGGAFTVAGWLGLVAGGLVVATGTMTGVLARAAEFGLRRSVGARRRHIAAQVLAESAILGLAGGLAGASLGVAVVVLLARARHWVPVIEPQTVLYAPLVATAAGMIAGLLGCAPGTLTAPVRPLSALPLD